MAGKELRYCILGVTGMTFYTKTSRSSVWKTFLNSKSKYFCQIKTHLEIFLTLAELLSGTKVIFKYIFSANLRFDFEKATENLKKIKLFSTS